MTSSGLPEGVPADNQSEPKSRTVLAGRDSSTHSDQIPPDNKASNSRQKYIAPETAIPGFSRSQAPTQNQSHGSQSNADFSRVVVVVEEDEDEDQEKRKEIRSDDDDNDVLKAPHPSWMLLIAIAGALSLLAFYVVNQNTGEERRYCSEQPAWNQYNCEPG